MAGSCARTEILVGQLGLAQLAESHIVIAGLGGVGGACAESLCRAGVGELTLIDFDSVAKTDLNRQIIALHLTLGQSKVEALSKRLRDINPETVINEMNLFIDGQEAEEIAKNEEYTFIADCIDAITCKTNLIDACHRFNKPIISSMGAGGRLDPTKVTISRMDKTEYCGLARELRRQLRMKRASLKFPVVHSTEVQIKALPHEAVNVTEFSPPGRPRAVNGAISYMPNIFGLMMAGHIIQAILKS